MLRCAHWQYRTSVRILYIPPHTSMTDKTTTITISLVALLAVVATGLLLYIQFGQGYIAFDNAEDVAVEAEVTPAELGIEDMLPDPDATLDPVTIPTANDDGPNLDPPPESTYDFTTKPIMITDGTKHSVPLNQVVSGGPGKDGLPSIDEPKYISIKEASDWLDDKDPGIMISMDGVVRLYPYQILVWHEIVNDTVNGKRILVTYCPLCLSGIVFDPFVDGERVEFGTSGKLWNSNLVMYDRKTDSYWSQVLGEAIVGEQTGDMLEVLDSDVVTFGDYRAQFPNGEVLSKDTGAVRFYGRDPYGSYYTDNTSMYAPVNNTDNRLPNKLYILGVVIDGKAKAYVPELIKEKGSIEDVFAETKIVGEYDKKLDVVRLYRENADGSRDRINPFGNFWFSWVAVHPETEIFSM